MAANLERGRSNQNQSKLNTIILGIASFGLATLIGIAMDKLDDMDTKIDKTNMKIDANKESLERKLETVTGRSEQGTDRYSGKVDESRDEARTTL